MEEIPLNEISIFEQWWQAIQPGIEANTLNFWQNIYKEIYMNIIKDGRWLQYLKGLGITLQVSFFAILVGVVLGTLLAILRLPQVQNVNARGKGFFANLGALVVQLLSKFAGFYINLFRGTPLLLQVLIINFGIFGNVRIDKVIIGVIACGLNSAAYVAEIVRGGILSVEKGQTEAGRSLGLSSLRTMMYIILPQAAKSALPAMCNEFISLIKETSVLSYIALTELTKAGDYIRSRTYSAFTPYIVSGLLYLFVVLTLTWLIGILERRLRNS
ncbi:MAG: amino acid ABC transporter permease, partial [Clostridia bacterium]|nr:amino acid ABC transporter permease [Clostridia bacterium]